MDGYVESYPHVVDDAEFDAANGSGPDSLATPQFDLSSPTQDYDLISGSNDSADDDNNERKQKKKRVRTTTVSAACSTCRRRHAKCDGTSPACGPCTTKRLECIWPEKRLKRGRRRHESPSNENSYGSMALDVSPAQGLVSPVIVRPSTLEQTLSENHIVHTYLQTYYEHVCPALFMAPRLDPLSPSLTAPQRLFLTSIAAVGAQSLGHSLFENLLIKSTRQQLSELFDELDTFVAATYGTLASYHNSTGALDKACVMNATACTMTEEIIKKRRLGKAGSAHDIIGHTELSQLNIMLLQDKVDYLDEQAAEELMEKISDKISVAAAELDADTIQMMRYCMLCTTHHMKLINRAQEFAYGDRKVAELLIKSFKDEMETQIPRKFWKPAMINRAKLIVMALSAAAWFVAGQDQDAANTAADALAYSQQLGTPYRDVNCFLTSLYLVSQVFMSLGDMQKYYECVSYIVELSKTQPIGQVALDSLEKIRAQRALVEEQQYARVFRKIRIFSIHDLQFGHAANLDMSTSVPSDALSFTPESTIPTPTSPIMISSGESFSYHLGTPDVIELPHESEPSRFESMDQNYDESSLFRSTELL